MTNIAIAMFALLWSHSNFPATTANPNTWRLLPESRVVVSGSTNTIQFSCLSSHPVREQLLTEVQMAGTSLFKGSILMKVEGFDCGNTIMNRDFYNTLREDEFADITLTIIELRGNTSDDGMGILQGEIELEIVGIRHQIEIVCSLENLPDGQKRIQGTQTLYFSDFGITPPRRALGLIRVENEITVDFSLVISKIYN